MQKAVTDLGLALIAKIKTSGKWSEYNDAYRAWEELKNIANSKSGILNPEDLPEAPKVSNFQGN